MKKLVAICDLNKRLVKVEALLESPDVSLDSLKNILKQSSRNEKFLNEHLQQLLKTFLEYTKKNHSSYVLPELIRRNKASIFLDELKLKSRI